MSSTIILPSNVDAAAFGSNIKFAEPKALDNGVAKLVFMSYKKNPIIIQTPEMWSTFGLANYKPDPKSPDKYSIDLSLKDKENRPSVNAFYTMLESMENRMVDECLENSFSWLKKAKDKCTRPVVEAVFSPLIRHSKDKETGNISTKYPPSFRLNLPYRNGQFECEVFNAKTPANLNELELKGAKVTAIIQCTGIWLAGGKFGCSWKVKQLRVIPPASLAGYSFHDMDDDNMVEEEDIDEEVCQDIVDDVNGEETQDVVDNKVDTSDDEEDNGDDEKPKIVKKIVRKKAT